MDTTQSSKRFKMNSAADDGSVPSGSRSTTKITIMEMTEKEKELMEKALLNPRVLQTIVKALDFPELKICRQINKTWKSLCSETIQKRDYCTLDFNYNGVRQSFFKAKCPIRLETSLTSLTQILQTSTPIQDFPCSHLKLRKGDLGTLEVENFFKIFGPHVKTLKLYGPPHFPGMTKKTIFCSILNELLPQLENLTLTGYNYTKSDPWTDNDHLLLPALKTLRWSMCGLTALKILNCASNLTAILDISLFPEDLNVLKESGKENLVKGFAWEDPPTAEELPKLAEMNLRLETADVFTPFCTTTNEDDDDDEIEGKEKNDDIGWEKILQSSKDTLKSLSLSGLSRLPKLPNVIKLKLTGCDQTPVFPTGINLSETFQNLQILDCTEFARFGKYDEDWDKYFPSNENFQGVLPTVKTLRIHHSCSEFWMSQLFTLCPNFKSVVTNCGIELPKICRVWPHVKSIEVHFSRVCRVENCEDFWMDPIVTGLSSKNCKRLRSLKATGAGGSEGHQKFSSKGLSVLDLQELKYLEICHDERTFVPFSTVVLSYAAKLFPDLKVVVEFDHKIFDDQPYLKAAYEELGRYVNVRHNKK